MMDGSMGSMMGWMMGIGLLGWVLVIALLAAIVILLFRLIARQDRAGARDSRRDSSGRSRPP